MTSRPRWLPSVGKQMAGEMAKQLEAALNHVVFLEVEFHDNLIGQEEGEPQSQGNDESAVHAPQPRLPVRG
ncbi:hypothetical protein FGK63_06285 [Ruegeria sediminis]|uniref:Uncharacterized protein n=1 Tax=Ruegeria sediminis TaxID=2583820 RepID=A0ABY2X0G1_9RHOB|nr:hypothetical protein [Ruegeria sediminis]TMV08725.1 hypothetical protein FGK63_06285 [Ruegeria sediminis]